MSSYLLCSKDECLRLPHMLRASILLDSTNSAKPCPNGHLKSAKLPYWKFKMWKFNVQIIIKSNHRYVITLKYIATAYILFVEMIFLCILKQAQSLKLARIYFFLSKLRILSMVSLCNCVCIKIISANFKHIYTIDHFTGRGIV